MKCYAHKKCQRKWYKFSRGFFNVPFGRYKQPKFMRDEMMYFIHKTRHATIACQDFETTMRRARRGSVVYADPPYVNAAAAGKPDSFTTYSTGGFPLENQHKLADMARELAAKGIPVVISNHDTRLTRRLYKGAKIIPFEVQRMISCDTSNRGKAKELLAVFAAC